jgi:Lipopolysaccharide kinase (Kdo/WaaP) family
VIGERFPALGPKMKRATEPEWQFGPDFRTFSTGRRVLVLHRDIARHADAIAARLSEFAGASASGAGNRAGAFRLNVGDAPEMFARRAKRGGLIRFLLTDLYFGFDPRPLRELAVTIAARRRGIAVAEPMGAMIERASFGTYRGFFLTRSVAGFTLWEFLETDDDPIVRELVLHQVREAIDAMHERGLFHADLNLHNVMVENASESFAIKLLDLDKARLENSALSKAERKANYARLIRSARKLDPRGKYIDAAALKILGGSA